MKMLGHTLLCCALPLLADAPPQPAKDPAPIRAELCGLFRSPTEWNGKMIRVRGPLVAGGGEIGIYLSAEGCKERIKTKSITWPNHIFLEAPENKRLIVHSADFHSDNGAWDRLNTLLWQVKWKSDAPEHVEGTVIGIFETRSPIEHLVAEGWGNGYAGFGDQNIFPAQIVTKTIEDMRIEPGLPPAQQ